MPRPYNSVPGQGVYVFSYRFQELSCRTTWQVSSADGAHKEADVQAERLARGEGNLHETAIALEKADIQMRLMMRGRDKVVQAYQEIMRMNV